jgi:biopolymer transport protein ExbD
MITRPLDLSSHLRPPPRSFEFLFYVNVGVLVLFFFLFGSRFVLAPGLGVDFRLPEFVGGLTSRGSTTSHQITVLGSGQIFADDGIVSTVQLGQWLQRQKLTTQHPSLLVLASASVSSDKLTEIFGIARSAGFGVVWASLDSAGVNENNRK